MDQSEKKRGEKTYDIEVIKWLSGFAKPYKTLIALSLLFMLFTAGLELLVPYITKVVVDKYIYPSWREATFEQNKIDSQFEKKIREQYMKSVIQVDKNSYLIDISAVNKEVRSNLEKYGIVSDKKFLVINLNKPQANRNDNIKIIINTHSGLFKSKNGIYITEYSKLGELSSEELSTLRGEDMSQVNKLALILFLILFGVFLFSSIYTYILNYSGQKIMHGIRTNAFRHILSLPQSFFDKSPVGRLTTRVTNDVDAIKEMYTSVLVQFIKDIIVVFGVLAVMFHLNRNLTLFILVLAISVGIVGALFRMKLKTAYRNVRATVAKLNAFVQESIRGMVLIKLYLREKSNFERFNRVSQENFSANMDQLFVYATFRPIIEFVSIFAVGLILWYGGLSVLSLDLTLGALLAYLYYVRMLFKPILEIAEKYNLFQSAAAASENLYDLMNVDPEDKQGKRLGEFKGLLEFKNVWFSYDGEDWVLKDVSFKVDPGQTVALVGLTGSGKTTIANLILRLYDIQRGEIFFDGVNIKEYSPEFLRQNISTVFQDLFLFGKNIEHGDFNKSDEFPKSVGTNLLASNGHSVSSGEGQIISLGKALSKDAKFLILDEATSHVDAHVEQKVRQLIRKRSEHRTTLIIAHRLSNVREADRIIVIHKGEITEVGTHSELLKKEGIYYNLNQLQNKMQEFSSLKS